MCRLHPSFAKKKCYNRKREIIRHYIQRKQGRGDGVAEPTNALLKQIVGSKNFRDLLDLGNK